MEKKIKTEEQIQRISKDLKREGKKIVAVSGSFDFFHLGHIRLFQRAKKQGDVLLVLLNSDSSVKGYKARLPIMSEDLRARTIASLGCVDYVVLFDELTPVRILEEIGPNVYCIGQDYGKSCIERKVVEEQGGRVHVLARTKGVSTSELISNVVKYHATPFAKAVFLDRDGTISVNEPEYLHKIEDFKFVSGAIEALKELSKTDYKVFIATNQSGISRGYFTKDDMENLHEWMIGELKNKGIRIDKIYHCPHHPDDGCECRKPGVGMFLQASKDFGINLSKSWMVGDDEKDVMAGRNANLKTIKIGEKIPPELKLEPHFYAKDLYGAVQIIVQS